MHLVWGILFDMKYFFWHIYVRGLQICTASLSQELSVQKRDSSEEQLYSDMNGLWMSKTDGKGLLQVLLTKKNDIPNNE